jgi:hypothetical protein
MDYKVTLTYNILFPSYTNYFILTLAFIERRRKGEEIQTSKPPFLD